MQQHEFTVPDCVVAFVVAELEDETTFVERVEINGQCTHRWITLTKGDVLRIKVRSGDQCTLSGYYESRRDHTTAPWRRNVLIDAFRQSAV